MRFKNINPFKDVFLNRENVIITKIGFWDKIVNHVSEFDWHVIEFPPEVAYEVCSDVKPDSQTISLAGHRALICGYYNYFEDKTSSYFLCAFNKKTDFCYSKEMYGFAWVNLGNKEHYDNISFNRAIAHLNELKQRGRVIHIDEYLKQQQRGMINETKRLKIKYKVIK